jgi:hypothetical protein
MSHDHPHDHEHDEGPASEHEIITRAMQELLEEKGLITADEVRRRMELFEEEFPQRGSKVIAHAWTDAAFRRRLLEDGKAACAEWGLELEADRLIAPDLVQKRELPPPRGARAARGAEGIRHQHSRERQHPGA